MRVEIRKLQRRLHDEALRVDGQHDEARFQPTRAHVGCDGRGIEADDAQPHAGIALGDENLEV